jgi:hypothetical protein
MDNKLLSALYDMTNANGTPNEILKAMVAGNETGRELNNQISGFQSLKPESLDPVLKQLEYTMKQIVLWNMIPKKSVFNTVHEFNQQVNYSTVNAHFMAEGDRPENGDSQYRRKSVLTKYIGLGGKLTLQAELVKHMDGKDPYTREVENKLLALVKDIDLNLSEADSSKNPTAFDGFFRNHMLGINEIYSTSVGTAEQVYDNYWNDPAIINANGKSLRETQVQDASHAIVNDRFGEATTIITNPVVLKDFNTRMYEKQRILLGTGANTGLTAGQSVNQIASQFGMLDLKSDVFFDRRQPIAYNRAATSAKAPNVPTVGGAPNAAITDTKNKFETAHAGTYYYVVTAKNAYGESAPYVINTSGQVVAATESVDLQFVNGAGNYPATSFMVYRTTKTPADRLTAKYHPLFELSVAELAAGFDGAAATKVRDRNRQIAGTHSAIVMAPSDMLWEYIQLMPTSKIEFALVSLAKEFAVVNFGALALYMPGKISVIRNIGTDTAD